jgi:hypothetical protein
MNPSKRDLRRTHLSRGDATLLSSHAGDPRTAVSDTTETGQALADRDAWGQLTADRGAFTADRTTPPPTTRTISLRLMLDAFVSADA